MSSTYGKVPISAGNQEILDVGGTGLSGVLIGNVSGLTCDITLQGAGIKRTLYPGTADFFEIPTGRTWTGNLIIDPMDDLSNTSKWPGSFVRIDTFGINERPRGTYPVSLSLTNNIGNVVDTNMSSTDIVNEGNPAGTNVVRAKQSSSSDNNILMLNDGNVKFAQYVGGAYSELFEIITGASPLLRLGKNLTVQGRNPAGTIANIFGVDGSGNTFLQNHSGGDKTRIYDKDGNVILEVEGTNNSLKMETPSSVINGGTSGTATHWMPFQGSALKLLIVKESSFRTAAGNQDFTLPTAFTNGAYFWTGDVVTWSFLNGGVVQNCNVVTAIGTSSFQATVTSYTFGHLAPTVPFDAIRHGGGAGSAHTGWMIIVGN